MRLFYDNSHNEACSIAKRIIAIIQSKMFFNFPLSVTFKDIVSHQTLTYDRGPTCSICRGNCYELPSPKAVMFATDPWQGTKRRASALLHNTTTGIRYISLWNAHVSDPDWRYSLTTRPAIGRVRPYVSQCGERIGQDHSSADPRATANSRGRHNATESHCQAS